MLIGERLQYLGIFSMCLADFFSYNLARDTIHDFTVCIFVIGIFVQGFRLHQIPMICTFTAIQILYGHKRTENLELAFWGTIISFGLFCLTGFDPNYRKVKPTGKYDVGFREFTSKELTNDCSVFYPIDKDRPDANNSDSVYFFRYGKSF